MASINTFLWYTVNNPRPCFLSYVLVTDVFFRVCPYLLCTHGSYCSGTTHGRPKFVPFNEDLLDETVQIIQTSFAFGNREYPIENGKALRFIYGSKQFKTVGGLTASTTTSNINHADKIKNMACECCSPEEVVDSSDVNVGEEYEIIVTNFGGFYRYRLGDVVKVVSFHNSITELQFIRRRDLVLNIDIDKNTEKHLQLAVRTAKVLQNEEKVEVLDFTSHVDTSTVPGTMLSVFYLNGSASNEMLCKCCDNLDRSFIDVGYVSSRKINSIGALELRIIKRGTFHKILDNYLGLDFFVHFKNMRDKSISIRK